MEKKDIHILAVEDNPADLRLLREILKDSVEPRFTISHCERIAECIEKLKNDKFDIVLLDMNLPDSHGLEGLENIVKEKSDIPVILFTGIEDEGLGMQAIKNQATDYLVKSKIDASLLIRSIRYSIERKKAEEILRRDNEFWTNTAQALRGAGMAEESRQAEQFANQEIGHHRFLEMLKTKTSPTAPQRAQDEQSEPIIRFMKRNYDMLPSDVVHKTRENFKISEKDAWELYQKVKTEYGERKGSNNGWRRIADDSVIQMAPTFGLPQGLPQGFTGEQQTTTQGQTQGIPQETSQYGRQPDGMYKYIYQNASVLVNPNLNNIIVNVYVNGSDENSIQVGLNSATQIANNAATVYARTIQMPVQLLSRLNHTPHGNYITVPFTFQANKIEQTTPTQQGTTASSWKSMQKLQ